MTARGADRRQTVQQRGVGVQDVGLDFGNDLVEPAPQIADDCQLAGGGRLCGQPGRLRRAEELPFADLFASVAPVGCRCERLVFSARDENRLPADRPLLVDDAEGAINIAALQRQRMIEDVKYSHLYED